MIENTRIDYSRADISPPSVSTTLAETYGAEFSDASIDECLVLVEAVALGLRSGGCFGENLKIVADGIMSEGLYTPVAIVHNEGIELLAVLQQAIVKKYSAVCCQRLN